MTGPRPIRFVIVCAGLALSSSADRRGVAEGLGRRRARLWAVHEETIAARRRAARGIFREEESRGQALNVQTW